MNPNVSSVVTKYQCLLRQNIGIRQIYIIYPKSSIFLVTLSSHCVSVSFMVSVHLIQMLATARFHQPHFSPTSFPNYTRAFEKCIYLFVFNNTTKPFLWWGWKEWYIQLHCIGTAQMQTATVECTGRAQPESNMPEQWTHGNITIRFINSITT